MVLAAAPLPAPAPAVAPVNHCRSPPFVLPPFFFVAGGDGTCGVGTICFPGGCSMTSPIATGDACRPVFTSTTDATAGLDPTVTTTAPVTGRLEERAYSADPIAHCACDRSMGVWRRWVHGDRTHTVCLRAVCGPSCPVFSSITIHESGSPSFRSRASMNVATPVSVHHTPTWVCTISRPAVLRASTTARVHRCHLRCFLFVGPVAPPAMSPSSSSTRRPTSRDDPPLRPAVVAIDVNHVEFMWAWTPLNARPSTHRPRRGTQVRVVAMMDCVCRKTDQERYIEAVCITLRY